jgi:hypothetical protein
MNKSHPTRLSVFPDTDRMILVGKFLLLLIFAISYRQLPLYSENQNTYFLHGLSNSSLLTLQQDWLARTTDPFPAFSALVWFTIKFLGENFFYIEYMVILALYVYSIIGIVCYLYDFGKSKFKYITYFTLLTLLTSGLLFNLAVKFPGLDRFSSISNPYELLIKGVAGQYILGHVFQPSTFGVFLIVSIYFFIKDKPFVAVGCLLISATFHSTYLLSAAILTGTYMVVIYTRENNFRKVLGIGVFAILLALPSLIYIYMHFAPTTTDITNQAQNILVDYRIPHHAKPSHWFSIRTVIQIAIIMLSLYLIRRTRLFLVLFLPFIAGTILTIIQIITGNTFLALLFPWRVTVFLVPIASSIILAYIVIAIFRRLNDPISGKTKPLTFVVLAIILIIGYISVRHTITLLNAPKAGFTPSAKFANDTFQPGDLYLVPPDMESFRLTAKVPIVIDAKSHPYKDTEVIEWFHRVKIITDFYSGSAETAGNTLEKISKDYSVTHVVMKNGSPVANCCDMVEVYRDSAFIICEIPKH